jgi:DNA-binding MarR family transcriptional regulator
MALLKLVATCNDCIIRQYRGRRCQGPGFEYTAVLPRIARPVKTPALKQQAREFVAAVDALSERLTPERRAEDRERAECSLTELRALAVLGRQRPIIMSDLAAAMQVTVSTATRTIDKLVAKGLAERSRVKKDRRVVRVDFSLRGEEIHRYVRNTRLARARVVLETLSPAYRGVLLKRLQSLYEA